MSTDFEFCVKMQQIFCWHFQEKIRSLIFSIMFLGLLEFQAIKTALLPRIKKLILQTSLLSVRVNGLISVGKLLPHLDKWLVMDEILPLLQQMPTREPAVIMASIGNFFKATQE